MDNIKIAYKKYLNMLFGFIRSLSEGILTKHVINMFCQPKKKNTSFHLSSI